MNRGADSSSADRETKGANRNGGGFRKGDQQTSSSRGRKPKGSSPRNNHRP